MTTIGENVRRYRKAFGLSQHALARLTGITQPNISGIERDLHEPTAPTVRRLAKGLGVPVAALFEEGPVGPPTPPKTPLTDERGAEFDKRFGRTGPAEAEALRQELTPEVTALEDYVKGLRASGAEDQAFILRRARAKLQRAKERLFAVQIRQADLDRVEGREAQPKATVAEYIPSAEDTEELLRMLLGEETGQSRLFNNGTEAG